MSNVLNQSDKDTCFNCKHYHACIADLTDIWHTHNFCDFWNRTIPIKAESYDNLLDDVENGEAYCWGFEGKF